MMNVSPKILSLSADAEDNAAITKGGVLCYGHFNVLHPGHFRYLEYAKSLGEVVRVFVMNDDALPETDRSHYFSIEERANALANLPAVDQVILAPNGALADAVQRIEPACLVLGKEYEADRSKDIADAVALVEKAGTEIFFHAGETHYAVSLLNNEPQEQEDAKRLGAYHETCRRQNIDIKMMKDAVSRFDQSRILVIGDTIIDQFVACDALGMSAEAPVIVVRELDAKQYAGGAAIVAAHAAALGADCHYLSVVGDDENARWIENDLNERNVSHHLIVDPSRPTTFKIRYMVERQKMFRVSRLKEHSAPSAVEECIIDKISELAPTIDAILISDFVYGVITPDVLAHIRKVAIEHDLMLFGDIQCSSQVGNVLKFEDFTLLCPTEREARIGVGTSDGGIEWVANQVLERTRSKALLMKLGSEGFIAYAQDGDFVQREHFPALISNPADVAGAGDSLLAVLPVALASGANIMEASAIGAHMAALSVSQMGNTPISAQKLLLNIEKDWISHGTT